MRAMSYVNMRFSVYRENIVSASFMQGGHNKEIDCTRQLVVRIAHVTDKPRLPFNCDICCDMSIYSVI